MSVRKYNAVSLSIPAISCYDRDKERVKMKNVLFYGDSNT